jgi:RNA polymerase sigma-70 factor (ECF subfamily)
MNAKCQDQAAVAEPTQEAVRREKEVHLLERCRQGDLTAFDDIVAHHQDRVFNLCYWVLGDRDDAADAAQEAFVRAFRALGRFRGDSAFSTWLHRIAVNVSNDMIQRKRRVPLLYADLASGENGSESDAAEFQPIDTGEEPSRVVLRLERTEAVRQALAKLPDHYRIVLVLFDLHSHSYEEVSTLLELPLGTVKSRLSRARQALRELLQGQWELFTD